MSMSMLTPALKQELMFLLLQYLDEEKYKQILHKFEQESRLLFNINYFEEKITAGDWDEAERYLSEFTKIDDNLYSQEIFFEIRRQKYLEALDQNDMAKAAEVLKKELKVFAEWSEDSYKELTKLLTIDKLREHQLLDTTTIRIALIAPLKKLIEANPVFLGKLEFPVMEKSRLRALINQSLNLQHSVCKDTKRELGGLTLYRDHTCDPAPAVTSVSPPVTAAANPATNAPLPFPAAATAPRANLTAIRRAFPTAAVNKLRAPILANQGQHLHPFQPAATAPNVSSLAGRMANATASTIGRPGVAAALPKPVLVNQVASTLRAPILANHGPRPRPFPPSATTPNVSALAGRMANATASTIGRPGGVAALPKPVLVNQVVNTLRAPILANQGQRPRPFPPAATAPNVSALAGRMANATASTIGRPGVAAALPKPVLVNQVSTLKHPRNAENALNNQSTEHGHLMKRSRSSGQPITDEADYPTDREPQWSVDDLPRTFVCTFHQESSVTSLDFHPSRHTLVMTGSTEGDITLWEIALRVKVVVKSFKIWNMEACSDPCKASFGKDPSVSITRVTWSPDGNLIGVAYTKHLIHLYVHKGWNDQHQLLEIDAHIGRVNDLAFAQTKEQLYAVRCGDDKQIKVWDLTGQMMYNFEGHDAPVYSVLPHHKDIIPFIFSTAADGKIKTWLYDNLGSRSDNDAPGKYCTKMMYSADGTRLFSCGTNKEGDPFLVEWDETKGEIKRAYHGFSTRLAGVVQFDTTRNLFLAAGEDHRVKFWNMDDPALLCSTEKTGSLRPADGVLQSRPCLRFNKEGNLLAVSIIHSGFKILANPEGLKSLKALGSRFFKD